MVIIKQVHASHIIILWIAHNLRLPRGHRFVLVAQDRLAAIPIGSTMRGSRPTLLLYRFTSASASSCAVAKSAKNNATLSAYMRILFIYNYNNSLQCILLNFHYVNICLRKQLPKTVKSYKKVFNVL